MTDYEKTLRELEIEIRLTERQWKALLNLCEDIRKEAVDVTQQETYDEAYERGKKNGRNEGFDAGYGEGEREAYDKAQTRIRLDSNVPYDMKRYIINRLRG